MRGDGLGKAHSEFTLVVGHVRQSLLSGGRVLRVGSGPRGRAAGRAGQKQCARGPQGSPDARARVRGGREVTAGTGRAKPVARREEPVAGSRSEGTGQDAAPLTWPPGPERCLSLRSPTRRRSAAPAARLCRPPVPQPEVTRRLPVPPPDSS